MAQSRILEWFVTSTGRKFTAFSAAVVGCGCFTSYLFPHFFFVNKTKALFQMYKDGKPVELPQSLRIRAQQVLDETSLTKSEKSLVSFFTAFGFDVLHAGSSQLKYGAVVGLPLNFNYKSLSDIDQSHLTLLDHPEFSWQSQIGQKVLSTLLLGNSAQKFAIAREIYYVNTHYVYTNGFLAATNFLIAYATGRYVNERLNLYNRSRAARLGLYSMLGSLATMMFVILKDVLTTSTEQYADQHAARIGKEYILGGIEYYEHMIDRNKALREALGEAGEKYFTAGGNVKEWVRVSQVPLTARLDFLKKQLNNIELVHKLDITPEKPSEEPSDDALKVPMKIPDMPPMETLPATDAKSLNL